MLSWRAADQGELAQQSRRQNKVRRFCWSSGTDTWAGWQRAGLINPFMSYTVKATGQNIASGIFNEILERLADHEGLAEDRVTFDDEQMKFVLDEMLEAYGVTGLLHSTVIGAEVQEGIVQAIQITGKSGDLPIRRESICRQHRRRRPGGAGRLRGGVGTL